MCGNSNSLLHTMDHVLLLNLTTKDHVIMLWLNGKQGVLCLWVDLNWTIWSNEKYWEKLNHVKYALKNYDILRKIDPYVNTQINSFWFYQTFITSQPRKLEGAWSHSTPRNPGSFLDIRMRHFHKAKPLSM